MATFRNIALVLKKLPVSNVSWLSTQYCTRTLTCLQRNLHTTPSVVQMASSGAKTSEPTDASLGLTLTDTCVQQINKIAEGGAFLRVVVESGGCSGFQYKFEIDSNANPDDRVFEKGGAKVVIDCDSLKFIDGGVIDYHKELIRSAFRVQSNPKADHGCSCGASFSVKP